MNIICKIATGNQLFQVASIRFQVFVIEQNIDIAIEIDEEDKVATHFLVLVDNIAVATARIIIKDSHAKLGRFAVLKNYRHLGCGRQLFSFIKDFLIQSNVKQIDISSQLHAKDFYQKLGFITKGEIYQEAGIEHIKMIYFIQQ